jgi:hypothetical protein
MSRSLVMVVVLLGYAVSPGQTTPDARMTDYMVIDLQRIEMIHCILDTYVDSLWPGWNGYRDAKFRFVYPNKLEMLVGQEDTPVGYLAAHDDRFPGLKVYVKTDGETSFPVRLPFVGGGVTDNPGFGGSLILIEYPPQTLSARWLQDWHKQKKLPSSESFRLVHTSDGQILTYIHELFHVFENKFPGQLESYSLGNLSDVYAAYSEIEGIALEQAFLEMNRERSRRFVELFLAARDAKQRAMSAAARTAEAHWERREGLCTYVELGILQYLRRRNVCRPKWTNDPWYFEFRDADYFLELELETLRRCREETMDMVTKRYVYGYYQALLLDRFVPGWKKGVLESASSLSDLLKTAIQYDSTSATENEQRLEKTYNLLTLQQKHKRFIAEGQSAVKGMEARRGRKYVLDLSRMGHLDLVPRGSSYSYDERTKIYCPEGLERLEIHNLLFETSVTPVLVETTRSVQWIDDDKETNMSLTSEGKDGEGLYRNVVVTTKGFTLRAARMRISTTERFIKLSVFPELK